MERSIVQILVVDDYEPWRRFVCSTLGEQPGLQVVGQAADGLEAVRKAQELQPDLILLDIGLPNMNGIEAARKIRELAPTAKILFVSQESSLEVAQEALRSGASGYVIKANAVDELGKAVRTTLNGERFVSNEIAKRDPTIKDIQPTSNTNAGSDHAIAAENSVGMFRVDMDLPMPVDLPKEEQIQRILHGSFIADCNDAQARMYGLDSAKDLIGRRMAELVVPDDFNNIELTRQFIRSGYRVLHRKSHEVDVKGNRKVFLNSMTGIIVKGMLTTTWGKQSDITKDEGLNRRYS